MKLLISLLYNIGQKYSSVSESNSEAELPIQKHWYDVLSIAKLLGVYAPET
jgi:hypothetical protein